MKSLALDLGKFNSTSCFFDTKTRKSRFLTTPTQREHLAAVFRDNKADYVTPSDCLAGRDKEIQDERDRRLEGVRRRRRELAQSERLAAAG